MFQRVLRWSATSHGRARMVTMITLAWMVTCLGVASPHFLTADNLLNVLQQSAINAVLGIGLTFVIISGGIDLSVGSVLSLSGLMVADALVHGHGVPVSVGLGVLTGCACGLFNGVITTVTRIPPFITTLGMMLMARSVGKIYSGAKPISDLPAPFHIFASDVFGIPVFILAVVVLYALAHFILTRTKLGRYTYAIGGNEQATWLAGVPIATYKIAIYTLSGFMAAVAAVLMTARLNAASPLAGEMYELYAIAAAVVGGVSLVGGEGGVLGTLIGALVMGMLRNGLNLLNVPSAWEGVVVGGVLIVAVAVDRARHRRDDGMGRTRARRVAGHSAQRGQWIRFSKVVLGVSAAAASLAFAVHYRGVQGSSDVGKENSLVIALIPKAHGSPFFGAMQRGAEAEAARLGVRLITLAPERETDVERQHQIIENLIEQGVKGILLTPSGAKELLPAIRKANAAHIPVLILDSKIDEALAQRMGVTTLGFIGSDNVHGGELAGEGLIKALLELPSAHAVNANRSGQDIGHDIVQDEKTHLGASQQGSVHHVGIIEGIPGHETSESRKKGFVDAIAAVPAIRVVASQPGHCERERGYVVAQNMLQAHPDLDGIFATTDEMALGAMEAVEAAHRLGKVRVVGYDANPDALTSVRAGRLLGTVAQFPSEMGRLGVQYMVAFLQSGAPPPRSVGTRVMFVDSTNVDTFSESAP